MIAEKLKTSTAAFHTLAEQQNFSDLLMNGAISTNEYIVLLKRLHAFFSQAQTLSNNYPANNIIADTLFKEKVNLLAADLKEIDAQPSDEKSIFTKLDYYTWVGFCYVPLGSLLGGQMICKKLMHAKPNLPISFYESCKPTLFISWKQFINQLETIDEQHHEDILNGARISYLYFNYLCTVIK